MRNGAIYTGEALNGNQVREGKGFLIKYDGSIYEGYWIEDKYHLRGRMIYPNGDYYEGGYNYGVYHGIGTKVFSDGK